MREVKIGIAEDQSMFRKGLINLINSKSDFKVVLEVGDGRELINKLRGNVPDIIFLDFRMPGINGIEAAKIISTKYPGVKILMLSSYDAEEFVIRSIANGAVGYITKEEDAEEIFRAIESVMSIGYYLNDRTSKHLIGNLVSNGKIKPIFKENSEKLTEQEIQVVQLMSQEKTSKEIAQIMFKGLRTIDGYKSSIMEKTGSKNACGVIMYGVKNGIIDLKDE